MKGMTAKRLRIILAIIMVAIIAATVAGFMFAQKFLADYATSISQLNANAQSGDKDLHTLQALKDSLTKQEGLIQKTRAIVGDSSSYADTVINDISQIGVQSGVSIKSIAFVDGTTSAATPAIPAPSTPSANVGMPSASAAGSTGVSVVKKTVTVSIQSPINYSSLMTFLSRIEANELRMHLTKVVMTKDKGNDVATQDLTIEVFVRQ